MNLYTSALGPILCSLGSLVQPLLVILSRTATLIFYVIDTYSQLDNLTCLNRHRRNMDMYMYSCPFCIQCRNEPSIQTSYHSYLGEFINIHAAKKRYMVHRLPVLRHIIRRYEE